MPVVVWKEDHPPIQKTINALDRVETHAKFNFGKEIDEWWEKVLALAKALCPVGTPASTGIAGYMGGSLRSTIRIIFNPAGAGIGYGAFYEVAMGMGDSNDITVDRMIVAGGMMINPNTGMIVDYAQAVHDGHFMYKTNHYVDARPFLAQALDENEPEFRRIMNEFMSGQEKEWERD